MKKAILTLAIILGMSVYSFAGIDNQGGGLFGYGKSGNGNAREGEQTDNPLLPGHNLPGNQDSNAPLGSGIVALIGFGAAYAIAKKREN